MGCVETRLRKAEPGGRKDAFPWGAPVPRAGATSTSPLRRPQNEKAGCCPQRCLEEHIHGTDLPEFVVLFL